MDDDSVWKSWKPYAAVVAIVAGGLWWYTGQSSFAKLKDGDYSCQPVHVNASGKYELLVTDSGEAPAISATVFDGRLSDLSAASAIPSDQLSSLTVRKRGTSHFHVTDDPAAHSYDAVACDFSG